MRNGECGMIEKCGIQESEGKDQRQRKMQDGAYKRSCSRKKPEKPSLLRKQSAFGGQKYMNLDSCFHRKPWIPAEVYPRESGGGNDENGAKRTFYEAIINSYKEAKIDI
jgi:hypothetical protein